MHSHNLNQRGQIPIRVELVSLIIVRELLETYMNATEIKTWPLVFKP